MSQLTDFQRGKITDHEERTLADYWNFSDDEMENKHDFIQWMFPLRVASRFNPDAPLVFNEDIAEFRTDPLLGENLIRSFDRFLAFLGMERVGGKVVAATDYDSKKEVWAQPDHNWLRVTRVLTCLRLFGFNAEARAFYDRLQEIKAEEGSGINAETSWFWHQAVHGDLT